MSPCVSDLYPEFMMPDPRKPQAGACHISEVGPQFSLEEDARISSRLGPDGNVRSFQNWHSYSGPSCSDEYVCW